MKTKIDRALQRTRRYWHVDGLTEVAFGGICLLLGFYFYLQAILPKGTLLTTLLDSSFVLLIVGGSLFSGWLVNSIKTRLTYPRTGFIAYRKTSGAKRWIGAGVALLSSALLASLMVRAPAILDWMPAITGVVLGCALFFIGHQVDLTRFYLLAGISVVFAIGISVLGFGNILGLALFYMLIGLALIISGGYTLLSYLRATRQDLNA